jgi:15,16-dihydrobiliverdin:ferredoxin oxidoreductase
MDVDGDSIDRQSREKIQQHLFGGSTMPRGLDMNDLLVKDVQPSKAKTMMTDIEEAIHAAQEEHGMPWQESIQKDKPLLYMPFWEWQMSYMQENLSNLRVTPMEERFEYNENLKKKARMFNLEFQSDEYRKIRMTYYDAGEGCQVFNSLWYPDAKYNLPVLGIDLLSFGGKKYLAIVDFQPIHDSEEDHSLTFEDRLAPVKAGFPTLHGKMSSKFYDETKFFSQEMLFARFDDVNVIQEELFGAFQKYVNMHTELVRDCPADKSTKAKNAVLDRHSAYDTYSADRDPATGLFAAMFGKEWADDFVYDYLFSLSDKTAITDESSKNAKPQHGPPPQERRKPQVAAADHVASKGSMHINQSAITSNKEETKPAVSR